MTQPPKNSPEFPGPQACRRLAGLFLAVNFLLLSLHNFLPVLCLPGTHWNWSGKILAIAFSCALLAWSPWLRQNAGLRWRQSPGSIPLSLLCFFVCVGEGLSSRFRASPMTLSSDTLFFQLLMPTLDEELSFRGIALALLERGHGQSPMSCRLRYGRAAFILALVFGFMHAISFEQGHLGFNLLNFADTFIFASMVTVVRTRSGSLLWPMLCHSAWNVAFFLPWP